MYRSLSRGSIGLLSALTLACGEPPTETSSIHSAFSGSAGRGAIIVRFEQPVAIFLTTEESGITLVAGVTAAELARFCAMGELTFETGTRLDVFRPDGSLHSVLKAKNLTLLVFQGFNADICASPPFAAGSGQFRYVDNDVFVSLNRTNSFGFRINGEVRSGTGQRYHVTAGFHAIISRSGAFRETRNRLRLTPRG